MSSLNPVVGVSLCIGALGAGLAYLAWNNQDEEVEESNNEIKEKVEEIASGEKNNVEENPTESPNAQEKVHAPEAAPTQVAEAALAQVAEAAPAPAPAAAPAAVTESTDEVREKTPPEPVELKTIKVTKNEKQPNMKQFLKESYENSKEE